MGRGGYDMTGLMKVNQAVPNGGNFNERTSGEASSSSAVQKDRRDQTGSQVQGQETQLGAEAKEGEPQAATVTKAAAARTLKRKASKELIPHSSTKKISG